MQSSMWKLLTAAGIIGIGTLVVLEVQNRLPMPSHVSNSTATAEGVSTPETDITPDASSDFDRLMASSEAFDDSSFALDEPNVPNDTGAPVPPAEDNVYLGASPVNRKVLKDNLADDDNPFDRALAPDKDSGHADAVEETRQSQPHAETTIQTASLPHSAGPETHSDSPSAPKAAGTSSTLFFNGSNSSDGSKTAARTSQPSPSQPSPSQPSPSQPSTSQVAASKSEKIVTQTSAQAFSENPTNTADETAGDITPVKSQIESDTPVLLMPDSAPEFEGPARPSVPRSISADDAPLMAEPGFDADPQPNFDFTPEPALPDPEPVTPEETRVTPKSTPTPSSNKDETSFFEADELVPTPPEIGGNSPSEAQPEPLPAFELDPVMEPDTRRAPADTNPESSFPEPSYPDRNAIPDLNGGTPFDSPFDRQEKSNDPSNLPAITDLPSRSTPDQSRGQSARTPNDAPNRNMSETMRPQLSIQKRAPDTATVGVSHEYTIVVSNEGDSSAYDVIVDDDLGNSARLENSRPNADYDRVSGKLSWSIRELAPHEKKEIVVRITPTGEGTLDGIATVRFKAQVKSATIITAPKLTIEMTGPAEVKVGDEVQLHYVIRNSGSGDASNVILRSVLPPGLKHAEGGDLEYEIENLRAGDGEEIELTVVAAEPGRFRTVSEVTASGISADKAATEIDIIGSQLTIQRLGPERRFVGRSAKFQNVISNETNFEANNAIVTEQVPEGMRFISADHDAEYNPQTGRIRWEIDRVAPGKQTVLEVELEAETAGEQQTVVEVVENAGFRSQATENTVVIVEDYENMTADISRQDEPVAIGETFGFTITIENRGTAVARNVEMVIDIPSEISVKAAGTRSIPARRQGNSVRYAIVDEIPPGEKMRFELKLQGERPARNALVRASLRYEQMKEPLIVSESVTVFDDRP